MNVFYRHPITAGVYQLLHSCALGATIEVVVWGIHAFSDI